jgi:hypothetical protein
MFARQVQAAFLHLRTLPNHTPIRCADVSTKSQRYSLFAVGVTCSFAKALVVEWYQDGIYTFKGTASGWTCVPGLRLPMFRAGRGSEAGCHPS